MCDCGVFFIIFFDGNNFIGYDAKRVSMEEDLTVLIDYEKYQEHAQHRRMQRQVLLTNDTSTLR